MQARGFRMKRMEAERKAVGRLECRGTDPRGEWPPLTTAELASLSLFRDENPDGLEWVLNACTVESLRAGEVVLDPACDNDNLYLILSGSVLVHLDSAPAGPHARLEAGDCVGEMSLIDGGPPSARVVTETNCRLLVMPASAVWSLIAQSHAVARNLLFIMSTRVRRDNAALLASLQQQRVYEQSAKIDSLTGLYNRRWLDEMLPRHCGRSGHDQRPLSLLMLDVDHFKPYNDSYGHLAGDGALRAVARAITGTMRPTDAAVRYGGEEFAIIMPDTNLGEARNIAERLCAAIRGQPVSDGGGEHLPSVTVSIGVAAINGSQRATALLAAADAALYRAKQAGRNCVAA